MAGDRSFFAVQARRWIWGAIKLAASQPDDNDLRRDAIVFAPHPDDETLACGGTIIRKVRAGADVRIVFLADGRHSHRPMMSGGDLKAIRAREGLAAAAVLGLPAENVIFLEFEDRHLQGSQRAARQRVVEILRRHPPQEIFLPYSHETTEDHFATNRIVASAIRRFHETVRIYEYPIWFWCHWPWAGMPLRSRRNIPARVKRNCLSGMRLLRDFRYAVYVGDVLEQKQAALRQHRSQMERLVPDPRWRTLRDVANGEFLDCFLREYELFRRSLRAGKR